MKKEGVKSTTKKTTETVSVTVRKSRTGRPPRLYVRAVFQGYRRSRVNQYEDHARLRLEGVNSREDARKYLGKRVVYVYRATKGYKTIWGKLIDTHGNNGCMLGKFRSNLPPRAIGSTLRVMLYPQHQ